MFYLLAEEVVESGIGSRWLAALGLFCFGLAYKYYAKWLANKRNFDLDDSLTTPAHEFEDGVDFVPTNRHVLFGHHFTSIAGAAPIVGPALAVIWGWLPAMLWVVFGSIFIGAVHDFANLVLSTKNKGKSLADLTGHIVGPVSRQLLLVLVMLLVWIVLAVFAVVIALLFTSYAQTVIPINLEIIAAVVIGFFIYRMKIKALWPSLLVLACLYCSIVYFAPRVEWVPQALRVYTVQEAKQLYPQKFQAAYEVAEEKLKSKNTKLKISDNKLTDKDKAQLNARDAVGGAHKGQAILYWIYFLLAYSAIASILPVWLLLQPRDFINSHQLMVGLGLMFLAVLIYNPEVVAPTVRWEAPMDVHDVSKGTMPLFPFLFITIACGAISGFHGLVGSGTTSKQLNKLSDAKPIGYGAMLGEASLALMATLACVAGFEHEGLWHKHYESWGAAGGLTTKINAFVEGGASFINRIFVEVGVESVVGYNVAAAIVAVLVISFAATTLDSACRIQRFIIGEIGTGLKLDFLNNRYVATLIAAGTPLVLILIKDGSGNPIWKLLWPLFGSTNQLLGALALLVITIYLVRKGKNFWITFLPMIFIMGMTYTALIQNISLYIEKQNALLIVIGFSLLALSLWISVEGIRVLLAHKKGTLKDGFSLK